MKNSIYEYSLYREKVMAFEERDELSHLSNRKFHFFEQ